MVDPKRSEQRNLHPFFFPQFGSHQSIPKRIPLHRSKRRLSRFRLIFSLDRRTFANQTQWLHQISAPGSYFRSTTRFGRRPTLSSASPRLRQSHGGVDARSAGPASSPHPRRSGHFLGVFAAPTHQRHSNAARIHVFRRFRQRKRLEAVFPCHIQGCKSVSSGLRIRLAVREISTRNCFVFDN